MARYIDADAFLEKMKQTPRYFDVKFDVENFSTSDVEEVKHGEWFLLDDCANEGVYCSVCHKKVYKKDYANQKLKSPRCPNCGAKMDGERK